MRYYYKSQDGKSFMNLKTPLAAEVLAQDGYTEITAEEFAELQPKPHEPTEEEQRFAELKAEYEKELAEIGKWFENYDLQVAQYNRCQRLGIEYDKDIDELDDKAVELSARIKELKMLIKGATVCS